MGCVCTKTQDNKQNQQKKQANPQKGKAVDQVIKQQNQMSDQKKKEEKSSKSNEVSLDQSQQRNQKNQKLKKIERKKNSFDQDDSLIQNPQEKQHNPTSQLVLDMKRKQSYVVRPKNQNDDQKSDAVRNEEIVLDLSSQRVDEGRNFSSARNISVNQEPVVRRKNLFDNKANDLNNSFKVVAMRNSVKQQQPKQQKQLDQSQLAGLFRDDSEAKIDYTNIVLLSKTPNQIEQNEAIFNKIFEYEENQGQDIDENDPKSKPLFPFNENFEQYQLLNGNQVINLFHYAIINKKISILKYLVEKYRLNLSLMFQIGSIDQQGDVEVNNKYDYMHTLKCALDTNDTQLFEYILNIGTPFYSDDAIIQFINVIMNHKDQYNNYNEYLKLLLGSTLFHTWFMNQNIKGFNYELIENLCKELEIENNEKYPLMKKIDESQIIDLEEQNDFSKIIMQCMEIIKNLDRKNMYDVYQETLRQIKDRTILTQPNNEVLYMIKVGLNHLVYQKIDIYEEWQEALSFREKVNLVELLLILNDLETLQFVLQNTNIEMKRALKFEDQEETQINPIQRVFSFAIQSENFDLFKMLYEDPIISGKIVDEDAFYMIYESIVDNQISLCQDYSEFMRIFLSSQTSHKIFGHFLFNQRFTIIEQLLLKRGQIVENLIEFIQDNPDIADADQYMEEQAQRIKYLFNNIYRLLSEQPYALYFFFIFPQVIQQVSYDAEEKDKNIEILQRSRDQISDSDFELYIWEKPQLCLSLIENLENHGDSAVSNFDIAILPFVMKARAKCDPKLLKKYIKNHNGDAPTPLV